MFQFRRFPSYTYLIQCRMTGYCPAGFPHSEIHGSMDICSSPWLIACLLYTSFRPSQTITAQQYVEFMLRALGYSSNANTDLTSTFDNAVLYGVLTAGERSQLTGSTFLRADLVYVSYYALDVVEASSGQLLSQVLQEKGVFTSAELSAAQAMVTSSRIW